VLTDNADEFRFYEFFCVFFVIRVGLLVMELVFCVSLVHFVFRLLRYQYKYNRLSFQSRLPLCVEWDIKLCSVTRVQRYKMCSVHVSVRAITPQMLFCRLNTPNFVDAAFHRKNFDCEYSKELLYTKDCVFKSTEPQGSTLNRCSKTVRSFSHAVFRGELRHEGSINQSINQFIR